MASTDQKHAPRAPYKHSRGGTGPSVCHNGHHLSPSPGRVQRTLPPRPGTSDPGRAERGPSRAAAPLSPPPVPAAGRRRGAAPSRGACPQQPPPQPSTRGVVPASPEGKGERTVTLRLQGLTTAAVPAERLREPPRLPPRHNSSRSTPAPSNTTTDPSLPAANARQPIRKHNGLRSRTSLPASTQSAHGVGGKQLILTNQSAPWGETTASARARGDLKTPAV